MRSGELRWTEKLESIYGFARGGFGGTSQSWRERVHPDDLLRCEAEINEALTQKRAGWQTQYRIVRADNKKRVLILAAVGEAATGVALLIVPSLVGRLLLGVELSGVSAVIGRVTGIALVGLGIACWPGRRAALRGMLTYSALATAFLAWLSIRGEWVGLFLWPAVVLHAVIAILLGRVWLRSPTKGRHDDHTSE